LPSWVPDWSHAEKLPTLIHWYGETNSTSAYYAPGRTKALVENKLKPGCLTVGAKFQGTVLVCALKYIGEEDVEPELPGIANIPKMKDHIASLWKCFASKLPFYRGGETVLHAFWRTMICNRRHDLWEGSVPVKSFIESFIFAMIEMFTAPEDTEYEYLCSLEFVDSQHSKGAQNVAKANESQIQINLRAPESTAEGASDHAQDHNRQSNLCSATARVTYESGNPNNSEEYRPVYSTHFLDAVRKSSMGRRFFLKHNGYIGVGQHNMEMGDQVAIFKRWTFAFHPSTRPLTVKKGRSCQRGMLQLDRGSLCAWLV
jgi:hypothetical protein